MTTLSLYSTHSASDIKSSNRLSIRQIKRQPRIFSVHSLGNINDTVEQNTAH